MIAFKATHPNSGGLIGTPFSSDCYLSKEHLPPHFKSDHAFDLDEESENKIVVDLEEKSVRQAKAAEKWFSEGEWFDGLEANRDLDDANLEAAFSGQKKSKPEKEPKKDNDAEEKMEVEEPVEPVSKLNKEEVESESESDSDLETDEEEAQAEKLREMEERIGIMSAGDYNTSQVGAYNTHHFRTWARHRPL